MQKRSIKGAKVTRSSDNIYVDLGLRDAEN